MKGKYPVGCLFLLLAWLVLPAKAYAASGVVRFTTPSETVAKGETVTVICQVTSEDAFLDVSFTVSYDDRYLTFLTGGTKVSGGHGILQVVSAGNTEETYKKTFSLQFKAKKKGTAAIGLEGQAEMTAADGSRFSVSSNSLAVTVEKKKAPAAAGDGPTALPQVTPEPVLSAENRLKALHAHCLSFVPAFTPEQTEYELSVDADTDDLYINYLPMSDKARVLMKGGEGLSVGSNQVVIRVIAENGKERRYKLKVRKETSEETEKREAGEGEASKDVAFSITEKDGSILLGNSYRFEVLDPAGLSQVPAGYIQSHMEINGIRLPVFTAEQDPDNNYLLLYLKGPSGQDTLYQFDREEKTLQRYTGAMTERINRGTADGRDGGLPISNYLTAAVVVLLVILLLGILIVLLKMVMERKGRT